MIAHEIVSKPQIYNNCSSFDVLMKAVMVIVSSLSRLPVGRQESEKTIPQHNK
ncbi:hypothetical protein NMS_0957 [Nonlabens marinus S1-08]|uniref:Uncharacterized protein n=1 Tax=Nonlabens marinus S1-08 TaxID=1454201 RepID=W8VZQ1_9FLAO|nr:hypothetical protein NMS_0957 [Nonlabens marinus S1-08]